MPGKEIVSPRRKDRKGILRVLVIIAVVLAGWLAFRGVVEADRYQLPHPGRALPAAEGRTAREHGFSAPDLVALLSRASSEGVARDGTRIALAIDEELQEKIFALFRRFDPPYGVFAAMEPDTGRVVALVGYRKGGEPEPRLALRAIYPAASLIKIVTASAALEKGDISAESSISYRGGIYGITRRGIHAKDGRGVPSMSLEEAIARSANAVFGKVAVNYVGGETLANYLTRFGFCQPIPFDLPVEESTCDIPRDEYGLARTGAGFGEVYVSPLHMAMIMSAIASSGEMPRPILIDRVEDKDGNPLSEAVPAKWRDTVKPETADAVLQMMVKTIEMGTSRRTFGSADKTPLLQDMEVAGKTGSLSGWTPRMHFEWFAGVAPVGDPKLAVAALVVNDSRWKIKGSYVGKEAFNTYFGYPSSLPPAYAKAKGKAKARWKKDPKKPAHPKARVSRKKKKKGSSPTSGLTSPRRNARVG
jgi:cell division protein FtsI/penicillin-binding protein 2